MRRGLNPGSPDLFPGGGSAPRHEPLRPQEVERLRAAPLQLGPTREGELKLGEFTRSDDGQKYLVADWRDIDDASFTLYSQRVSDGRLRLAIAQFNN